MAALVLVLGLGKALAQGLVNFANGGAGVNAPVTLSTTGQLLQGAGWQAQLWQLDAKGALLWGSGAVNFVNPAPGYFLGRTVAVPGTSPGQQVTLTVRVYGTNGVTQGYSKPVSVVLGGGMLPPPNLVGLQAWTVGVAVPVLNIQLGQGTVTLSWAKDLAGFVLEATESLSSPQWTSVAGIPQIAGDQATVTLPIAASGAYFRLRLGS